ncbi:uncharacterized protein LOC129918991 [Episyrphus balteatus]|uniref:uncharacterized protein LOC129918991 n=1 Tax=Episyrphus balteatus TaxID=286459 RepID=UPI0024856240|nr:uncharacterized protein LOC129918991 [Episyrphus balteatus]
MISSKLIAFIAISLGVLSFAYAQLAPGSNTYLPPTTNGYNYPEPEKPFPPGKPPGPKPPGPRPPGRPGPGPGPGPDEPGHVHVPGNPYEFDYAVKDAATANDYSHKASSNGDVVEGEYRVALPNGRTQVVRYTADWKTGFHADVTYEN